MKITKRKHLITSIIAFAVIVMMMFSSVVTASASEEDVRKVADGVMLFSINIDGESYGRGSCFLINEDTIITSNHCVHFTDLEYELLYNLKGYKRNDLNKRLTYTVTIQRDFTIPATLVNSSENMDFAILKLSQPISNHTCLKLRDSKTVNAAETAYSVGFPVDKDTTEYFNQKDIVFESGTVNRTQYTTEISLVHESPFFRDGNEKPYRIPYQFKGDTLLVSGNTFNSGNSGGPLVDSNGNVIGICMGGSPENDESGDRAQCSVSAIDQVMEVLDTINIKYTKADGSVDPDPNPVVDDENEIDYSALQASISKAEAVTKDDYTEESYKSLSDALVSAKAALNAKAQEEVDSAKSGLDDAINNLQEKPQTNLALIIAIVAAVVLIAIITIVIVVVLKGKNKEQPAAEAPVVKQPVYAGASAPSSPTPAAAPDGNSGETSVLNEGGSETTVLSGDGGETTVLSQSVNGGKLIRSSNNENIPINYSGFSIGRKRQEVDYCVGDNTNVGRKHASFIVRDGVTYIVDNKSTNGTYVNNTAVRPGQEVALNDGDTIMLANEKFVYKK